MPFRFALLFVAASACAGNPPPRSDVPEPSSPASASAPASSPAPVSSPPPAAGSVEEAAGSVVSALAKCDAAAARPYFLSYDEMTAMTDEVKDASAYDRTVSAAIARRCKEIGGASYFIRVVSRDKLRADRKMKRDVEIAIVRVAVERSNDTPDPEGYAFFKTDRGWKLSAMR